jgi:hypothetical protein
LRSDEYTINPKIIHSYIRELKIVEAAPGFEGENYSYNQMIISSLLSRTLT